MAVVSRRALVWTAVATAVLTFAVYLPSIAHPFVNWDDESNFVENLHYRGLGLRELRWMFTTFHEGPYQPLSWVTLGLDYVLWGMSAWGYHLTNVGIHAAAAGILCALAVRLHAERSSGAISRRSLFFGVCVGLVWLLHPLRVEAVSWVTERREVLCGALSFWTLLHAIRGGSRVSVAVLALCAMLAKGTAVVLAPLLILLDLYRSSEVEWPQVLRAMGRSAQRHAAVIAVAFVFAAVAILGQSETRAIVSYDAHGLGDRLRIHGNALGFYVWKTLWPSGLAPMYDPPTDRSALTWPAIVSVVLLAAFVWAAWSKRRRVGNVWTIGAAYFVLVLPVGGLVQVGGQMAADRYSYQPGAAITIAVVACLGFLLARRTTPVMEWAVLLVACAGLGWRSVEMQSIWQDSASLWRHQLAQYPDSPIGHLHLGLLHKEGKLSGGSLSDAETHFRRAVQRLPGYSDAWCALGDVCAESNRNEEALDSYDNALRATPTHRASLVASANLLWRTGHADEALATLQRLVDVAPDDYQSHLLYGRALTASGASVAGIAEYELALRADPTALRTSTELAWSLATHPDGTVRNGQHALELAQRAAIDFGPREPLVVQSLTAALAEVGRFEEALAILGDVRRTLSADDALQLDTLIEQFRRGEPLRVPPSYP